MRVECRVSDAKELATAKKDSEVCLASDAHFRPFDDCREFAHSESASSVSASRRLAGSKKKSAGDEFTLGTQLFLQQFLGVVTLLSSREEVFAARSAMSLESEPNQTLEPTIRAGTPRAEPRVAPAPIAAHL